MLFRFYAMQKKNNEYCRGYTIPLGYGRFESIENAKQYALNLSYQLENTVHIEKIKENCQMYLDKYLG